MTHVLASLLLAHTPAAHIDSEMGGTRKDLADFLRSNRRRLKVVFCGSTGGRSDDDLPTHHFFSRVHRMPFKAPNGALSQSFTFTIFPF